MSYYIGETVKMPKNLKKIVCNNGSLPAKHRFLGDKILAHLLLIIFLFAGLTACSNPLHFINYSLSNTPRYSSTANPPYKNTHREKIKVVSYNIKHSARIKEAINLLRNNEDLANADILLLQEMV
jgi:hypothetical protein